MFRKSILVFGLLVTLAVGTLFGQWWGMTAVTPTSAILGHQILAKNPLGWYQSYIPLTILETTPHGNIWYAVPSGGNLAEFGAEVHLVLQIGDPIPFPK